METSLAYLFLFAALQGVILALSLLLKKNGTRAQTILAIWIGLLSIDLVLSAVVVQKAYSQFPHLIGIQYGWPYLYGPFLLLYVKNLVAPQPMTRTDWLHFLPFVILKACMIPFFALPAAEKIAFMESLATHRPLGIKISGLLLPWQGLLYVSLSIRHVLRYRRQALDYFSAKRKVYLTWLTAILLLNLVIWVFAGGASLWSSRALALAVYPLASLIIFITGYFGLNQPQIFLAEDERQDAKYAKTKLGADRQEEIKGLLLRHMDAGAWQDSQLTIKDISNAIDVPIHQVSQVINAVFEANLFTFVNGYRLREAKRYLREKEFDQMTILEIAFRSGFNSKTSFNTLFKAETGLTPTEFRSRARN